MASMDDFSIERTLKGFPAEVRDFLRIDKREKIHRDYNIEAI